MRRSRRPRWAPSAADPKPASPNTVSRARPWPASWLRSVVPGAIIVLVALLGTAPTGEAAVSLTRSQASAVRGAPVSFVIRTAPARTCRLQVSRRGHRTRSYALRLRAGRTRVTFKVSGNARAGRWAVRVRCGSRSAARSLRVRGRGKHGTLLRRSTLVTEYLTSQSNNGSSAPTIRCCSGSSGTR